MPEPTQTTPDHHPSPPPAVWRWLGIGAVALLLTSVVAIALISAGTFDPQPVGELIETRNLAPVAVAGGEMRLEWLNLPLDDGDFTLRLTGAGAHPDAHYGLALGRPDDSLVVAVSPAGDVALWRQQREGVDFILPWQPWAHVRKGGEANEIQIDVRGEQIGVRVNRELLWERPAPASTAGVALLAASGGEPARINFQQLELYR
ncbi:MAG: hypothetical protein R3272_09870 [Candidatus Promineifilaceae bacterium]|nr:hypothetical protein [Candidatus Promineifilaceae bacterium]